MTDKDEKIIEVDDPNCVRKTIIKGVDKDGNPTTSVIVTPRTLILRPFAQKVGDK